MGASEAVTSFGVENPTPWPLSLTVTANSPIDSLPGRFNSSRTFGATARSRASVWISKPAHRPLSFGFRMPRLLQLPLGIHPEDSGTHRSPDVTHSENRARPQTRHPSEARAPRGGHGAPRL